jgi:hypothetical protein
MAKLKSSKGIKAWLNNKAKTDAAGKVLGALLTLVGAALAYFRIFWVVYVTFWVVYVIIVMWFAWGVPMDEPTRLWLSGVVLVLLTLGNATIDRRYLESYSFSTGTQHRMLVTLLVPGVGFASTLNPFAPDSAHSIVKIITGTLLIGPRLLFAAVRMLNDARRLAALDAASCAPVLALLYAKDERVPLAEVQESLEDPDSLTAILSQLRLLDGVLFLTSEPAGLALMSELRAEIRVVKRPDREY